MDSRSVHIPLLVVLLLAVLPAAGRGQDRAYANPDAIYGMKVQVAQMNQPSENWDAVTGGGQVIQLAESTVGMDQYKSTTMGMARIRELNLLRSIGSEDWDFREWMNQAATGDYRVTRPWLTTTEMREDYSDGLTTTYHNVFPVRYVFPKLGIGEPGAPLTESFSIQANGVEGGSSSRAPAAPADEVVLNYPRSYRVEIEGIDSRIIRGMPVAIGDLVIPAVPSSDGRVAEFAQFMPGQPQPGQIRFEVYRREATRPLAQWWEDVRQGKQNRKQINISIINSSGTEVRTYSFYDCLPVSYDGGDYYAGGYAYNVKEVLVVQPARVEFR